MRVIPIIAFEAWESAICARCVEPGHCCKRFHLSGENGSFVCWDEDEPAHTIEHFHAIERLWQWTVEFGPDTGRTYSAWVWTCDKLGDDGRCTIYEDRPDLCRRFEPLSDGLCIMGKRATA